MLVPFRAIRDFLAKVQIGPVIIPSCGGRDEDRIWVDRDRRPGLRVRYHHSYRREHLEAKEETFKTTERRALRTYSAFKRGTCLSRGRATCPGFHRNGTVWIPSADPGCKDYTGRLPVGDPPDTPGAQGNEATHWILCSGIACDLLMGPPITLYFMFKKYKNY
jgi:hypothetical protein